MALERKPVEETQEPGYPSTNEYVTGRRAFIGLLGLTALGVGGAYILKAGPSVVTAGEAPPVRPPLPAPGGLRPVSPPPSVNAFPNAKLGGEAAAPQAITAGRMATPQPDPSDALPPPEIIQPQTAVDGGLRPVRPQAQLKGDVIAPEPPARPQAITRGEMAMPEPPDTKPLPPAQPRAEVRGRMPAVVPVQPEAATDGKPKPPVKPQPDAMGY